MHSPPEAVLFDLDNTLWHRDVAVRRVAAAQHAAFRQLSTIPADVFVERVVALDDRGRADKAILYKQIVNDFSLPVDLISQLHNHFWATYQACCEPAPGAIAVLSALRTSGIKTGLVTNGTVAVQEPKIRGLGLSPLMDTILVSEREGVRKPDAEIFRRAITCLGIQQGKVWFVGDHPEADIRGAAEAGLTAVWLRSWADAAPHATYAAVKASLASWRLREPIARAKRDFC